MESRLRWMEMQAEIGQKLYYECGTVILATEGHCDWEDATAETFDKVGVPYHKFTQAEVSAQFPQFDASSIRYALFEPQSGMVMAHRAILVGVDLFRRAGGTVRCGRVTTDADEKLYLDKKPLQADLVIPDEIDLDNDERFAKKEIVAKTRRYIKKRLPGLVGEKVVDSKFNQIILTPDTYFIVDWHPRHDNVLLAGGCSGHLFKHGPVFGGFVAGAGLREYGTAERFKITGR